MGIKAIYGNMCLIVRITLSIMYLSEQYKVWENDCYTDVVCGFHCKHDSASSGDIRTKDI